jgi:hypothetical protein
MSDREVKVAIDLSVKGNAQSALRQTAQSASSLDQVMAKQMTAFTEKLGGLQKRLNEIGSVQGQGQDFIEKMLGMPRIDRAVGKIEREFGTKILRIQENLARAAAGQGRPGAALMQLNRAYGDLGKLQKTIETGAEATAMGFNRMAHGAINLSRGLMMLGQGNKNMEQMFGAMMKFEGMIALMMGLKETFLGFTSATGSAMRTVQAFQTSRRMGLALQAATGAAGGLAEAGAKATVNAVSGPSLPGQIATGAAGGAAAAGAPGAAGAASGVGVTTIAIPALAAVATVIAAGLLVKLGVMVADAFAGGDSSSTKTKQARAKDKLYARMREQTIATAEGRLRQEEYIGPYLDAQRQSQARSGVLAEQRWDMYLGRASGPRLTERATTDANMIAARRQQGFAIERLASNQPHNLFAQDASQAFNTGTNILIESRKAARDLAEEEHGIQEKIAAVEYKRRDNERELVKAAGDFANTLKFQEALNANNLQAAEKTKELTQQLLEVERRKMELGTQEQQKWLEFYKTQRDHYQQIAAQEKARSQSHLEELGMMSDERLAQVGYVGEKIKKGMGLSQEEMQLARGTGIFQDVMREQALANANKNPLIQQLMRDFPNQKLNQAEALEKMYANLEVNLEKNISIVLAQDNELLANRIVDMLKPIYDRQQTLIDEALRLARETIQKQENSRVNTQIATN